MPDSPPAPKPVKPAWFIKAVAISLVILFSAVIAIYFSGKTIPELKQPITLTDAQWVADGGTTWLMLKDADGKQFMLGVSGSLDRPPAEFPVFVQRWYPWVPVPVMLPMRGDDEQTLLKALDRWTAGGDPASMVTLSLGRIRWVLAQRSPWITQTVAMEPPAVGLAATARLKRVGADLQIELKNFPSFRSLFDQPVITRNPNGSVTVSLKSSSQGLFSNKSEQLTHISLKVPAEDIPPRSRVFFFSADYDRVFVSAVAP
jgi:hypothetical protein